ncbi:MAG: PTS sugar transporter subunit IIA, partial [Pseudomonadota bacterium]
TESSTFFNEGVAFPHVRLNAAVGPLIALGIAKQGISDSPADRPVELGFLILTPKADPDLHVRLLGVVGRAARDRQLVHGLLSSADGREALAAICRWEALNPQRSGRHAVESVPG